MKNVEDIELIETNYRATVRIKSDSAFLEFVIAISTDLRAATVLQANMKLDSAVIGAVARWATKLTRSRRWQTGNGQYESACRIWTLCGEAIDNFFNA